MQLTELAISSIRDVSGINLELLGLRDANQPGILEAQRKRAAMTILATAFNALRRYRKAIGRIRLHYIQTHLSDGRMVRIMGKQGAQVLPVIRAATVGSFDESPSSPNQKEATWAAILGVLPGVRDIITPDVMLTLLEFSPLPESLVERLRQLAEQSGDDPEAQQARAMALEKEAAEIRARLAKAGRDEAETFKTQVETTLLGTPADPNVARTETPPFAA